MGDKKFWFIDGCVSPYNNPSVIAFLTATLPEFNLNWETGEDKLLLVSVGTGLAKRYPMKKKPNKMHIAQQAEFAFNLTIDSQVMHEDLLCRLWGRCLAGPTIDSEIGDQKNSNLINPKLFTYLRYDRIFTDENEICDCNKHNLLGIDNINAIPFLQQKGTGFAEQVVDEFTFASP